MVTPGPRRRSSFGLGVILMAFSFGIYLAYPMVPFLPISAWNRSGVFVGLSIVSWGIFCLGFVLAGRRGVVYLRRRLFFRRR